MQPAVNGRARNPEVPSRRRHVAANVSFEEELTEFPETEVRLLAASRPETLRRLAVTLLGLSDDSLNAVLNLACRMRRLEGLPVE